MIRQKDIWIGMAAAALLMMGCGDDDVSFQGSTSGSGGDASGGGGTGGTSQGSGGNGAGGGMGGAGGMEPVSDWSCLGTLPAPGFMAGNQTATFQVTSLNGTSPVIGATVNICGLMDFLCDNPLGSAITDNDGEVTLPVTTAQPIFVETTSSITQASLRFVNGAVQDGEPYGITPITPAELTTFATTLGGNVTPGAGHVAAIAVDCEGNPAAGVEFTLDNATPDTLTGYIAPDGSVDPNQTVSTSNGGVIFINVPAGFATVNATLQDGDLHISNRVVFARGDWVSDAAPNSPTPAAMTP